MSLSESMTLGYSRQSSPKRRHSPQPNIFQMPFELTINTSANDGDDEEAFLNGLEQSWQSQKETGTPKFQKRIIKKRISDPNIASPRMFKEVDTSTLTAPSTLEEQTPKTPKKALTAYERFYANRRRNNAPIVTRSSSNPDLSSHCFANGSNSGDHQNPFVSRNNLVNQPQPHLQSQLTQRNLLSRGQNIVLPPQNIQNNRLKLPNNNSKLLKNMHINITHYSNIHSVHVENSGSGETDSSDFSVGEDILFSLSHDSMDDTGTEVKKKSPRGVCSSEKSYFASPTHRITPVKIKPPMYPKNKSNKPLGTIRSSEDFRASATY